MTLALGGLVLISFVGNKEKKEMIPTMIERPKEAEEMDAIKREIEEIKQMEMKNKEEIKEILQEGRYDYVPFETTKEIEKQLKKIK